MFVLLIACLLIFCRSGSSFFVASSFSRERPIVSLYVDSRDDVDGGSVTTNPNTTSVGKLRYMANALHYASKRTKAVHDMSEMDHECLGTLNAGELKTLLVASVELGNETILGRLLEKYHEANKLTSVMIYVAIRQSFKKRSLLALYLLHESKRYGLVMDVDTINSVVDMLVSKNKLIEAFELLQDMDKGAYGVDNKCDAMSICLMIEAACKRQQTDIIISALTMCHGRIASSTSAPVRLLDNMNLVSPNPRTEYLAFIDRARLVDWMSVCSSNGDANSTIEIFAVCSKQYGKADQKILILLLSAFLNSKSLEAAASLASVASSSSSTNGTGGILDSNIDIMNKIVDDLIDSNEDSCHIVSNLVFRYFCEFKRSIHDSQRYLQRVQTQYTHRPSMLAISSYSELFYEVSRTPVSTPGFTPLREEEIHRFHDFMCTNGYFPMHCRE